MWKKWCLVLLIILQGTLLANACCQRLRGGSGVGRGESAMGVNEKGAYDFRSSRRSMPPPFPMPPRSFLEVGVVIV